MSRHSGRQQLVVGFSEDFVTELDKRTTQLQDAGVNDDLIVVSRRPFVATRDLCQRQEIPPMVKKLILAVKEGEFPVVGYFAGLPFLLSSSHAQHSIEEGGADSSRSSVGMVITCPHAR